MKRINHLILQIGISGITAGLVLTSCKKDAEVVKHDFKATIKTWYRVSPTAPTAVMVNGISYVRLANLVVGGEGNATFMGKIESYANTLSYSNAANAAPIGSIGAPVKDIPVYPLLGAPLPLVQAGDFAKLPAVISALKVPSEVGGNTVSLVMYNNYGDALFLSNIPGTGTSTLVSPTVGGYTNKTLVVGGAGKFIHATGELNNSGYFSFVEPLNGEDTYKGWISY